MLIDAYKLIESMTGACNIFDAHGVDTTVARTLITIAEKAPTVNGWISIKDGLPEKSGNVLVCVKLDYADGARYVQMCHYSAYKKQFGCFDTLESNGFPQFGVVTHWMPLPEPPEVYK